MKTILGFGASSMQGVGDPEGGFFFRLARHPLTAHLSLDYKNHGIGGNSLGHMLARAEEAVALQPYDLVVLLGCNDLPRARDASPTQRSLQSDYRERVQKLLQTIQAKRSLFITSFSVSEEKTGVDPKQLEAYMSDAMSAAVALGYETWDLHQETKSQVNRFWATDGLHFNADGHSFIADRVAKWITES